jgi:hypothetical protein
MAAPMSTLSTFATLTTEFPTWTDLKEHIENSEPSIEVLEFEGSPYVILKYRDAAPADAAPPANSAPAVDGAPVPLPVTSDLAQVCRSVIWNTDTNSPCCVAPFAARRDQKIPMEQPLSVEDFVEGVMINVFRARDDETTHVTTRSKLDADGKFYSERTFRELFDEAMEASGVSLEDLEGVMGSPDQENVTATFMSLVLVHPEHRVVQAVEKPRFWVIYRGVVKPDGSVDFHTEDLNPKWRPKSYTTNFIAKEWTDLKSMFEEIKKIRPWNWQGLIVHHGLQRWRFRNSQHDHVRRDLRGSESNPFGRFLRLRANKKIQEYLRIYPEESRAFEDFEQEYRQVTKTLYAWYCRCHKEHSLVFKDLPKSVQPLVFGLHKMYLENLRPNRKTLRLTETIDWVLEHLVSEYGVPNFLRLSKETVQPPESTSVYEPPVRQASAPRGSVGPRGPRGQVPVTPMFRDE